MRRIRSRQDALVRINGILAPVRRQPARTRPAAVAGRDSLPLLGAAGRLALFLWSLALVMLAPAARLPWAAALAFLLTALFSPGVLRRLLRPRWLLLLALMALPPLFFMGEPDRVFMGVGYASLGLATSVTIVLRFLVVVAAVDSFTSAVDISTLAGLLERFGLRGLGFSLGVALNLLPALRQSALNAWQSLWMRGGLRKQSCRALQLLLTTIAANALKRAEEISMAAEARAFTADAARPLPLGTGALDLWLVAAALATLAGFILL